LGQGGVADLVTGIPEPVPGREPFAVPAEGILPAHEEFAEEAALLAEAPPATTAAFAAATAHLAEALSPEAVVDICLADGLPALAAGAGAVYLLDFRLELTVAALAMVEAGALPALLRLDEPHPVSEAVRLGRPVGVDHLLEQSPARSSLALGGLPGVRSTVLPLAASDRILGALWAFYWGKAEPWDLALSRTLARRVASALQRAQAMEAERRVRVRAERTVGRLDRLHSMTAGLAAAVDPVDVAEVVITHGLSEMGASGGALYLARHPGESLRVVAQVGQAKQPEEVPVDASTPVAEAARRGAPILLGSAEDWPRRFHRSAGRPASDLGALAVLPLTVKDRTVGALLFGFDRPTEFGSDARAFLSALATHCALALERARLYQDRADEARQLQQSLLPIQLDAPPDVEIGARYRPFREGSIVGGDFFDSFVVSEGRWAVMIGDVCGKGVRAATLTALARYTIRTAALYENGPGGVLRRLNELLLREQLGDRFCTVAYAELASSAPGISARVVLGGHPLPLLLKADGELREVGVPGTALGLFPDPSLTEVDVGIAPGDALVMFTDGWIDARSAKGDFVSREYLRKALSRASGGTADEVAQAAEEALVAFEGGPSSDDMALIVVRVIPTADGTAIGPPGAR
jgi:serine phosphatase RsbU (regulator of sigma subunit)